MPVKPIKAFIEVGNALRDKGTRRAWLIETAQTMAVAAAECTENDPAGSRGQRRYQMGTRRLRELHLPTGDWERDDRDQIASILNRRLNLRIVVCSTDDGTCIESREPKNRSQKGPATERLVEGNRQPDLFEALGIENVVSIKPREHPADEPTTCHLCVYHEGEDLRAELSLFIESTSGYFGQCAWRIFILGGEAPSPDLIEEDTPDSGADSDFDIPVTRKK